MDQPSTATGPCALALSQGAVTFDPEKHLVFKDMPKITTMEEIGLPKDLGVSPVAVTGAFPLFSLEAINMMRSEILAPKVQQDYNFSSNIAASQLRGYARDQAPFTYAAWTHPDTIAIVSKLAGIDLVPWGDYEIAHINLSSKTVAQVEAELKAINQSGNEGSAEDIVVPGQDKPIVGWHTDSYPFVCVLMMSDVSGMVGGETALRTADNQVLKVRGPSQGCAAILQGRYITHQAVRALGAKERITAVTSWRPRSPFVRDDSVLRTVRGVSNLNELYYDFGEYRLEILAARVRQAAEEMRTRRSQGEKFDTRSHKALLEELSAFVQHTKAELVEEEQVQKGAIEEVDLPDAPIE
ncbi:ubiquitin-conjugating enzyme e2 [Pyrenophora seminiperda CCB06]|uniref:Ubiquitin-conjugating enzyme e2 n=1 Tax=Pyrenophora seminiperda CCB06 TaxID=1302712 RepID=A0A3M7MHK0_9PLEO|nr:ubiquitin-conjugating enzyme e2 [Pyrenophora seminiperda CCB06]